MKKWTIRILVLLFLLTGSACSQSVPPAEGEETLSGPRRERRPGKSAASL